MSQAVQQRQRGLMGPPAVPTGIPVRSGAAAATKQALLSPPSKHDQPPQQPQQQRMSMPPPRGLTSSSASSTSSRPSLARSDASGDSARRPHSSYDERIKTPLQESHRANQTIDAQFDDLLNQLEVPSTVRLKFATVTKDVKRSILDSSMNSNPALLSSLGLPVPPTPDRKVKGKMSAPALRKAKSSNSVRGGEAPPPNARNSGCMVNVGKDQYQIVSPYHSRGYSIDMPPQPNFSSASRPSTPTRPSSVFMPQSPARRGEKVGPYEGPETYVKWLESFKATDLEMDVGKAKKLRMLLRHETTGWVAAFLEAGGYARVLDRVQDLLDIEWREEQHDDKMLYELLRCVKALSTSEVGKAALRAAHPRPFPGLSSLLFSEKKPGDLACRQIIVELWLFYFELFPKATDSSAVRFKSSDPPNVDAGLFVRSLLLPETENKAKDHHEFITTAHRPRIFKAWVQEMSDICRDYFWIMCHGSNTLWRVNEVDEQLVERPVAPGGATGGVEFEAMGYVTTHFRLLNTLATKLQEEHPEQGQQLHQDLLMSGLDRILVTLRKASTTYYPTLHLELARYIEVLRCSAADGKLPYLIGKLVGPPPEELRRHRSASEWLPRSNFDGKI